MVLKLSHICHIYLYFIFLDSCWKSYEFSGVEQHLVKCFTEKCSASKIWGVETWDIWWFPIHGAQVIIHILMGEIHGFLWTISKPFHCSFSQVSRVRISLEQFEVHEMLLHIQMACQMLFLFWLLLFITISVVVIVFFWHLEITPSWLSKWLRMVINCAYCIYLGRWLDFIWNIQAFCAPMYYR